MPLIGLKFRGDKKLKYIEGKAYDKDKDEKHLQKIIEDNPKLVLNYISDKRLIVLGGKIRLTSGKEPDLVVCDGDGYLYILELKKGRSPREVITQLLDYASSLSKMSVDELIDKTGRKYESVEAIFRESGSESNYEEFEVNFKNSMKDPQLFLISYEVSDEVKRITDWLRTKHELMINCVEFDYYEQEGIELFVPRIIELEDTQEIKEKKLKPMQKKYLEFYNAAIEKFKEKKPGVTSRGSTWDTWLAIPSGHTDIHFEWNLGGREPNKRIEVRLDFEMDSDAENKKFLEKFKAMKNELENKIGEKLEFGPFGQKGWMRVITYRDVGTTQNALENEEIVIWTVETMVKFYDVMKPLLDEFASDT